MFNYYQTLVDMDDEKKSGGDKLRQPKKASATVDCSADTLDSASLESIRLLIRSELDPLKIELANLKRDNNMLKDISLLHNKLC